MQAEHDRRLRALEAEAELLLTLVATTAYWGNHETDRWWLREIEQLSAPVVASGGSTLLNLAQAPATMVIYSAGIAALAAERWHTLVRVLQEPRTKNLSNEKIFPAALFLGPRRTIHLGNASEHLYGQLRPVFKEHLALSDAAYVDAWERFELLRLIARYDTDLGMEKPYIRRAGILDEYRPAPTTWLKQQLEQHGDLHPLLQEGFLDGSADLLFAAGEAIEATYSRWISELD